MKIDNSKNNYIFLILLFILSFIVLFVQLPVLDTDASCFDDGMYLTDNKLVKNPGFESAKTFMGEVLKPSNFHGYYQPFSMISLMVDYSIAKSDKDLYVFHRTSLIIHVINVILLACILFLLFKNPYVAIICALIFGIHPMTVETIAWVSERKTTLASFFALFSIMLYVLYTQKNKRFIYILCSLMYIFSLLSKPTSTMLPVVLILLDFWPLKRIDFKHYKKSKSKIIEKIPFFLIAFISSIVTYLSQKNTASVINPTADSFLTNIFKVCYEVVYYPLQMIFPHNQTAHYPVPDPLALSNPIVLAGFLGTIAIIIGLFISIKKTRSILTGWLIFLVLLFPTMGVIGFTSIIMSDKYAYLPSFGFVLIIATFIDYLWNKKISFIKGMRIVIILIALMLSTGYSYATRNYISLWKDTHTYYTHMQKLAPDFPGIYNDLATDYCERGDLKEAKRNMEMAVSLDSNYFDYHWNLGIILEKMEDYDNAVLSYKKSMSIAPDNYKPYRALGVYYNSVSQYDEAIKYFGEVVKLSPNDELGFYGLAFAQIKTGKIDEGFVNIQKSVQLNPKSADFHCLLGEYYSNYGEFDKAIESYQTALKNATKKEEFSKIYLAEGITRRNMNQIESSIESFKKALSYNPKFVGSYIELSNTFLVQKRYKEALELHEKAILEFSSNIDLAMINNSWGYTLAIQGDISGAIKKFEKAIQIEPSFEGAKQNLERILLFMKKK